ncbi:hypothetical protein GCM10020358_55990 [Amorphoplanes nipponensis]|uniref:NrtR DNA-binding winged helix domain-containing protein n=1 Tax=Actinoplanes nipponensis TaxID=135950 RepID=A0A919MPC5_9ACTN|nr:hypothetical protein Ani05nite_54410 [Actinoplanes nipponensis]
MDGGRLHLEQLGAYGEPDRDPRGRVVSVAFFGVSPAVPPTAGSDAMAAAWRPVDEVRGRLEYTTLATLFCGQTFTLDDLRRVYEAVWGQRLDPGAFAREVARSEGFEQSAALLAAGDAGLLRRPILRMALAE